jgi:hypothetical protein
MKLVPIDSVRSYPGNPRKNDGKPVEVVARSISLYGFQSPIVIDLDAYGVPFKQLEIVFQSKYKGIVFVTFIQSVHGMLPRELIFNCGFTPEMVNKIPSLFNRDGFGKLKSYLYSRGIQFILYYQVERKFYMAFNPA